MSRAKVEQRSVEAYSLHGRTGSGVINYVDLFSGIADLPLRHRQASIGQLVVGVTVVERTDFGLALRFVSGTEGQPAIFFDTTTGEETAEDIGTRVVAVSTWMFVDPTKRLVALERRRPGVGVATIERALEILGLTAGLGDGLRIDLNPVPSSSFTTELESLDRIREAAVVLHRPNWDWLKDADALSGYSDESGADRSEVQLNAGRGKSLNKDTGIVADIRRLVSRPINALKDVRVVGTRSGESKERSVRLENHRERVFVPIAQGADEARLLADASRGLIERIEVPEEGEFVADNE